MEEIEGSVNGSENDILSNLGQNENPSDETLGAGTRVYSIVPDSTETVSLFDFLSESNNNEFRYGEEISDSQKWFENLAIADDENKETVAEDALVIRGDVSQQNEFNLGEENRVVSKNCISLFVEVFGPPNGFEEGEEQVLVRNPETENIFIHDKKENPKSEDTKIIKKVDLSDDNRFLVGDVVWVRSKTDSWWPGQIIDLSSVSNVASKPENNASFLVKYIGNYPNVWCSPIWSLPNKLKPFMENFEQMSSLKKYRKFPSAVEKAVDEFGRQIKAKMTCSCKNSAVKEKENLINKRDVAAFEPANFLYLVKNIAWNESNMGKIELVKVRSHLSVFYRSLGHHQLPMDQLCKTTNGYKISAEWGNNLRLKNEIGSEDIYSDVDMLQVSEFKSEKEFGRDRKRSKYLSYPFLEGRNDVGVSNGLSKKLITRRHRKATCKPKLQITPRDLDTPLVDLLSKLRLASWDYILPSEKRDFDLVCRVFNGFRNWIFHEKIDQKYENEKKSKDEFKSTSNLNIAITPKQRRKKEEISTSSNGKSTLTFGVFDVNKASGSFVINFEEPGSFGLENIPEPKKRKRKAKKFLERMQGEKELVLPDLNKKCTIQSPFVVNSQPNNITMPLNEKIPCKTEQKVRPSSWCFAAETNSGYSKVNLNFAENGSFLKSLNDRERVNNELMNNRWDDNGNKLKGSSLGKDAWLNGFLGPEAKKRKRKEKTPKLKGQSTTIIPDLNGNANITETNSESKVLPEINSAPSESKPPKKKKRKKKISGPRTDLNPCFSKVLINGESSGTALILTFAQGFPVPSKEDLIAKFSGFGSLNENETKGLSDKISAQVVFKNGSDAVEALRGIEKSCPFGPVLVKCRLHHISSFPREIGLKPCELKCVNSPFPREIGLKPCELKCVNSPFPREIGLKPCELKCVSSPFPREIGLKPYESKCINSPFPRDIGLKPCELKGVNGSKEAPNLDYIRKNLEMMRSVLEKGGDNLSAEMREKLENGVEGLLKKVGNIVGSTSSS